MLTKIIEVTNGERNWGKFMLGRPDAEWNRLVRIAEDPVPRTLLSTIGWTRHHLWVLDLQTGEGACFLPGGMPSADLNKHRVWVCPMFEPFLAWLYQQNLSDLAALPDTLDLPDAPFAFRGYRRKGTQPEFTPTELAVREILDQLGCPLDNHLTKIVAAVQQARPAQFPFRRGDYIQHVSGRSIVFKVVLVDDEKFEAFAEPTTPGIGTRVINPSNWKKVEQPQ